MLLKVGEELREYNRRGELAQNKVYDYTKLSLVLLMTPPKWDHNLLASLEENRNFHNNIPDMFQDPKILSLQFTGFAWTKLLASETAKVSQV
jgi:hypothetical protein